MKPLRISIPKGSHAVPFMVPAGTSSLVVRTAPESRAVLVVRDVAPGFSCRVTLAERSSLCYVFVQDGRGAADYRHDFALKAGSELRSYGVYTSCNDIRNIYSIDIQEEGCNCSLQSIAVLAGQEKLHQTVDCRHVSGGSNSNQSFRHLVGGEASATLIGRILVPTDSQRTEAYQQSRNLLLSGRASVHVEPQLEIYADDVKCSHGATMGQLDADALFYLQQRGIAYADACNLLLAAEVRKELDSLPASVRRPLLLKVSRKLKHLL